MHMQVAEQRCALGVSLNVDSRRVGGVKWVSGTLSGRAAKQYATGLPAQQFFSLYGSPPVVFEHGAQHTVFSLYELRRS